MKLFSRLRTKLACLLSKLTARTSWQSTPSTSPMTPAQWEMLSGLLSLLSSMAPSSTRDTDTILQLEHQVMELEIRKAKAEAEAAEANRTYAQLSNLPHRTYIPTLSHDGLQWVAVAQFSDGSKLVGRGHCPNTALMDYSNQWLGIKGDE